MKKHLLIFIKIVISATIIILILNKLNFSNFSDAFRQIDIKYILISALMLILNFILITYRWQLLLFSQKINIRFYELSKINLIGYFFNNFLLGTNGGDLVKIYYIAKKEASKKTTAITTVFLDRLTGFASFLFIATIMCTISFDMRFKKNLLLFFGICYIVIFIFFLVFNKQFIKRLLPHFLITKFSKFTHIFIEIYDSIQLFRSKKKDLLIIFIISIAAQFFLICSLFFIGLSIGINVVFYNYLTFIPIIQTIASIPVSLSGLGLMEGSYVYFFKLLGISVEKSFALSLIARGFTYILGFIGLLFYLFSDIKIAKSIADKNLANEPQI